MSKGQTLEFEYVKETNQIDVIIILSKYSLRNIEIRVKNGANKSAEDLTFTKGGYLCPNGYYLELDFRVLLGRRFFLPLKIIKLVPETKSYQ